MSQSDPARALHRSDVDRGIGPLETDETTLDTPAVLSLLSDEYARRVLRVLVDESQSAAELVDRLDMSRATVYRRLDRLESAGILGSSMCFDPDGHHRQQFHVLVNRLQLVFESDGIALEANN
jgi:response regulator of citrate/malate metabolism